MRSRPHSPARAIARPRKRLGQNFLVDPRVARAIVSAAAPLSDVDVLEIGPGHGALTALLLRETRRVTAVEIDRRLAAEMRERFAQDGLTLIEADILKLDWSAVAPCSENPEARLVVIGNLPYNISKPLAMRLVAERRRISRAVLTLQREVVDRLVARPGSREYGALGILVGQTFDVERLFDVRPGAFRPRPKVISSVARLTPRAHELGAAMERTLRACLAASFSHRRRTLYNNLRSALPDGDRGARAVLEEARLDGSSRPETIPPEGFLRLARAWPPEASRPTRR